jgi:hypothetical protein
MAPWAVFGVVAVVVVAATTAWSASLRGPDDSLGTGSPPTLAQVPVLTPATPEPTPEPTAADQETSAARATRERARTTTRAEPRQPAVPPPAAVPLPAAQPQEPAPPATTVTTTTRAPRGLFPTPTPTCTPGRLNGSGAPCRTTTPQTTAPR